MQNTVYSNISWHEGSGVARIFSVGGTKVLSWHPPPPLQTKKNPHLKKVLIFRREKADKQKKKKKKGTSLGMGVGRKNHLQRYKTVKLALF